MVPFERFDMAEKIYSQKSYIYIYIILKRIVTMYVMWNNSAHKTEQRISQQPKKD